MPNPQPVRILIADDHLIFREGLRMLLEAEKEFAVVGQAGDGDEATRLALKLRPDILLLDLAMPRVPGLEALRELAKQSTPMRTILLTASVEPEQIVEALQLGARGVVLKECATELLLKSIRAVVSGDYWVGRGSVPDLVKALSELSMPNTDKKSDQSYGLTSRELQIVESIVAGFTNKDVAQKFSISEQTVKHHLSNIFDKLGVSNRLELALFAVHHNLIAES